MMMFYGKDIIMREYGKLEFTKYIDKSTLTDIKYFISKCEKIKDILTNKKEFRNGIKLSLRNINYSQDCDKYLKKAYKNVFKWYLYNDISDYCEQQKLLKYTETNIDSVLYFTDDDYFMKTLLTCPENKEITLSILLKNIQSILNADLTVLESDETLNDYLENKIYYKYSYVLDTEYDLIYGHTEIFDKEDMKSCVAEALKNIKSAVQNKSLIDDIMDIVKSVKETYEYVSDINKSIQKIFDDWYNETYC